MNDRQLIGISDVEIFNLALRYDQGDGVDQNKQKAIELYQQAADLGHAKAIFNLALSYDQGDGVDQDKQKAIELYQQAADLGNAKAIFNLALSYKQGDGVDQDKQKAIELYQQAADLGYAKAIFNLALLYKQGDGVDQDKQKAIELYQQAAELGYAKAILNLALSYKQGDGVDQDKQKAIELYQQAADLGHASAIFNLALSYDQGDDVDQDKQKAIELYQQAADLGHAKAILNLALSYDQGDGVDQDKQKAIELYQQAADLGNATAIFNLALSYDQGDGVDQDKQKAIELYQQAAELGHAKAIFNLALSYDQGDGVDQNKQKAIELYQQAADLGNAKAIFNLALSYKQGDGVDQDKQKAIELYQQAADLGNASAIFNLALSYKHGDGVDQNKQKAAELFTQAAENGHQKAALYAPHKLIAGLFDNNSELEPLREHFLELEDVIRSIKERHIYNDEAPLAHFTSWKAIENILPEEPKNNNVLRLYNVDYMNDPTEGRSLINLCNADAGQTNTFLNNIFEKNTHLNEFGTINSTPPSIYSLSFTESSDRLDLWRAYGNDGNGFSIVTTFSNSQKEALLARKTLDLFAKHQKPHEMDSIIQKSTLDTSPILFRVFYKDKEKLETIEELNTPLNKIQDVLSKLTKFNHENIYYVLYATLLEVMYLYKDEQYSTEREVRAIQAMSLNDVKLDERNPGRIYCETAPFLFKNMSSKIVIGPKVQDRQVALWNLRYRLNKNGFGDTTSVEFSDVNYR